MIRLVLFDLDGTLYDYNHCNQIAEQKLYEMMSKTFDINTVVSEGLLKEAKVAVKNNLGEVAASHNRMLYMQKVCEMLGKNPCEYALKMYNLYWDTMLENMKLYGYVIPLFEYLRKKQIKIALLTDLTALIQYRKIDTLKIGKYIDFITTSEEVGEEKPSLKAFQVALHKAKVEPQEVLMIGDSNDRDIKGAVNAGIKAVLYENQENFYDMILEQLF